MRCRNAFVFALGCAACVDGPNGPAPVGVSAGSVTVSGGLTATEADPQTSSGDSGTASGTGTGTGSGTTDGSGGSETTGGVAGCANVDDPCEGQGFCVAFQDVLRCSHGEIGDPCDAQGNDCGLMHHCVLTQTPDGELGVCTGSFCDVPGDPCDNAGTCAMVMLASGAVNYCSHGNRWEPCTVDDDCVNGSCDAYPDDAAGTQYRCN